MSETTPDMTEQGQASEAAVGSSNGASAPEAAEETTSFAERYGEIIGKVNQTLDSVDWNQMGRIGKATGVIIAVIVIQVLIKGVLDTINLNPLVPGLLELLGLVVVGQWSWNNLTTSEKRNAVISKIQSLRNEYLG